MTALAMVVEKCDNVKLLIFNAHFNAHHYVLA